MEKNIANTIEDINLIKETMENAKINFSGTYLMCFLLGFYNTISFLMSLTLLWTSSAQIVLIIFRLILTIAFFIGVLLIYRREKKHTNKYYLSLVSIWGIIVVAIPVMSSLLRLINRYCFSGEAVDFSLQIISSFSNVLLFCIFIIIYSFMISQKYPIFISLCILFLYLFIFTCFSNIGVPLSRISSNISLKEATLVLPSIFNFFIVDIGYIFLGFVLKKRSGLWR